MNPPDHPDCPFLDIETITPEKWRALMYNRIVQQKDVFINDFKSKVISNINECMQNVLPNTTLESLQTEMTNQIIGNKFEFEYKSFIDGIVGATFEYVCQFIIKNSMDNIKRTQSALKYFSLLNNTHAGNDEGIKLQVSNINNPTDTDKIIQSHLFNDGSQGDVNSLIRMGNESTENSIHKLETTAINNYINSPKVLPAVLKPANETVTNSILNVVEDDDFQTTQSIISLALNISQQDINFGYPDGFEEGNVTNENYVNINNTKNCSSVSEKNVDLVKSEDEYTTNGLKILESLVNIEHSKLEDQKTLTENNCQQSNIKLKEKEQGILSNNVNSNKNKSPRSKEKINKKSEEERTKDREKKKNSSKKRKISNEKKGTPKINNIKVKIQNNLNNSFPSHTVASTTKSDISTITTNTKAEDSKNSVVVLLKSQNTKDNNSTNKVKTYMGDNNTLVFKKENIKTINYNSVNNVVDSTSTIKIKSTVATSNSSNNEKYIHTSKNCKTNNTSNFSSPRKVLDYQMLYEKDRKSLFNPDIIITTKLMKDSENNGNKYSNPVQQINLQSKSQNCNLKSGGKISSKKQKNSKHIKARPYNDLLKNNSNIKCIPTSATSSIKKSPCNTIASNRHKFKKLKVCKSDDKFNVNTNINITEEISNSDISGNQDLNNMNGKLEKCRSDILENSNLNFMDSFENAKLKYDEWIKEQCEKYDIKPSYVIIDPNKTYN